MHLSVHLLIITMENRAIRNDDLTQPVEITEEDEPGAPVLRTGESGPGRARSWGAASPAVVLRSHTSG